jgi:16S rRNA (guanine527-N7)-methyltransferase
LAAIQPATVHLYESNAKKAAFLKEALRQMKVEGVVHGQRLELRKAPLNMPHVQLVTARAFAPLDELLAYAEPFMARGATGLFHKGQDVDAELTQAAKSWKISAQKHSSLTDSKAVILDVKEIIHVNRN